MNRIRHNSPSPIQCLRAFHILFSAYLLFRCYCYKYYKNPKTFTFSIATVTITIIPLLLLNTLLQILSYPGVVELTTQLLIFENILWLPLCRINKFGLYFTLESCCDPLHLWVITDYFLAPLPGSIALFFESLGIYICWSLWRTWNTIELLFFPQLRGEVRNCHLALH